MASLDTQDAPARLPGELILEVARHALREYSWGGTDFATTRALSSTCRLTRDVAQAEIFEGMTVCLVYPGRAAKKLEAIEGSCRLASFVRIVTVDDHPDYGSDEEPHPPSFDELERVLATCHAVDHVHALYLHETLVSPVLVRLSTANFAPRLTRLELSAHNKSVGYGFPPPPALPTFSSFLATLSTFASLTFLDLGIPSQIPQCTSEEAAHYNSDPFAPEPTQTDPEAQFCDAGGANARTALSPSLRELHLSYNGLEDFGALQLLHTLRHSPIRRLCIWRRGYTPREMAWYELLALRGTFFSLSRLEKLALDGNKIGCRDGPAADAAYSLIANLPASLRDAHFGVLLFPSSHLEEGSRMQALLAEEKKENLDCVRVGLLGGGGAALTWEGSAGEWHAEFNY
ncbi:hypothetical protein JCM6882_007899 [Rhodosporidiobolus microsporus]